MILFNSIRCEPELSPVKSVPFRVAPNAQITQASPGAVAYTLMCNDRPEQDALREQGDAIQARYMR